MGNNIKEIKTKKFEWFDITGATQDNLKFLKQEFGFDSVDLGDCLPTRQRQKIHQRKDYLFLILQFPHYNRETKTIESSEVDLFIGKKFFIVIHDEELTPLVDFFAMYQSDPIMNSQLSNESVVGMVHKLLNKLYTYCYPILNHLNLDIVQIEKDILEMPEEKTIKDILIIKRNIVNFQKTMQSHRGILQKLLETTHDWRNRKMDNDYNALIAHTRDIWDYLTNYKDTINALHETQESMTSLKINEIMKTLTIFSVVVFPLTLLAAIFGMNTMNAMPFMDSKHDFWYIIGIMAVGMIVMFGFFKKKKWL
jgi:magnesium transporter